MSTAFDNDGSMLRDIPEHVFKRKERAEHPLMASDHPL